MLLYNEAGKITKSMGLIFEAHLPGASIGSVCSIVHAGVEAEVVGFREKRVLLMPYDDVMGINHDSLVVLENRISTVRVGTALLGRVLDGRGRPMDGKGPIDFGTSTFQDRSLYQKPSDPLQREMISQPMDLGVRALNGMLTVGKGQRVGIMAGSGVGKSVLLGMMAKRTKADVNVIALLGERGREVREFIERDLGPEGLARSVLVVATSDASPLLRMRAAFLAASIAEGFRDEGKDVLMMMDSVTRFCMAQREIGLSMGEPPTSKGYTPSVFSMLPKLLERAGTGVGKGSITGLFTVLVEGDEMDDPVADSARSILDGHFVLSRKLAERNHYPAIDVLQSVSRVMPSVTSPEHRAMANQVREWMSIYAQAEDLIQVGAYVRGANARVDDAVLAQPRIEAFLRQPMDRGVTFDQTLAELHGIVRFVEATRQAAAEAGKKEPTKPSMRI